jgi:hypothetical protein
VADQQMETAPPADALVLFDGHGLGAWTDVNDQAPRWRIEDGAMVVVPGSGDLVTRDSFGAFQLHLEFWLPLMPRAVGQDRANSGIYLQGRYELQILDSAGAEPSTVSCGAIYESVAPLWNACLPPETWQSFDVAFRPCRLDTNGLIRGRPRATVFCNGVLIHNNVSIAHPTAGPLDRYEAVPGPLRLQDHGCPVRFRNVWVRPTDQTRQPCSQ